jgi:hypothetical protein
VHDLEKTGKDIGRSEQLFDRKFEMLGKESGYGDACT